MKTSAFPYTLDVEQIPTDKLIHVRDGKLWYQCPESCWGDHMEAWRKQRRNGNADAPEPMPNGHCCFERPASYGCVPYGDNSEQSLRAAWTSCIRGDLSGGWMEDGPKKDALVAATVDAKIKGIDTGAQHFLCAAASWMD